MSRTPPAPGTYYGERQDIMPFVPATVRKALDVGCGVGLLGAALKQIRAGCEVWGVEPTAAAEQARRRLDHVVQGLFGPDLAGLPAQSFDLILFLDVLEHMPEPELALRTARQLLAPGGVILASIPNARYMRHLKHVLIEGDWRYESKGVRDRTHLRFFTRKSALRLFADEGYQVHKVQGINKQRLNVFQKLFLAVLGSRHDDLPYEQFVFVVAPGSSAS